ncbi:unnamed protein product [Mytilus edulis]|uniref:FAS1 domain-containing protein n=1 Tax=Mytilus edulis TaxID=6550 RepID=A0A8S3Q2Z0_MYTED|nr:unnamed protein product [Mytilus edulis]
MFRFCCIFLAVHCVLGGNLIEVLQANGESKLIKYATACGLADTILGVTVEGAKISKFDLNASNGIVHVIDKVLVPPTGGIVDLVSGNKDLGTLLSLVQKANITGIIRRDPLTVFAPTNAAFSRLPANVLSRLNSDTALLKEVLEYHLVPHTAYSPGLYNREYIRTLDAQKDVIRLSVSGKVVSVNSYGRVIKADIPATNGVVHLIDHVLIPIRYWLSFGFGK